MAITALVIAVTVDLGGMPLLPAKVLAVGVSFLVVFALRRSVVFAGRRSLPTRGVLDQVTPTYATVDAMARGCGPVRLNIARDALAPCYSLVSKPPL